MLTPAALEQRASNVPGSREMLALTPVALYARRLIAASNRDLARWPGPLRWPVQVRWAWLLEGAARWFSGQTEHARPAIARRLREGPAPSFPPGVRDAALLGGTVVDLLAAEEGERAAVSLASQLDPAALRPHCARPFGAAPWPTPRGPGARTCPAWPRAASSRPG